MARKVNRVWIEREIAERKKKSDRVLELLRANPFLTAKELAELTGFCESAVRRYRKVVRKEVEALFEGGNASERR